jgi:hypothetical protein
MPVLTQNDELAQSRTQETPANRVTDLVPSGSFKYYIHDSVSTLRFQLIGDLREGNVTELNGSWETAQTTLKFRRLVLDLSQLDSADQQGRKWLLQMKEIGAAFRPNDQFEFGAQVAKQAASSSVKLSLVGRILAIFRPKP